MKIGVILINQNAEVGGGYRFQWEILTGLFRHYHKTKHQFTVIGWTKNPPSSLTLPENIEYVSLYQSLLKKLLSEISRITKAILRKLRHPFREFVIEKRHEKFIFNTLKANNIEVVWNITPNCLTLNIPYITTVWDLQHRLQPYFPEVSQGGEWEKREKHYQTILKRATYIITGTQTGKSEIEKFYQVSPERIAILPFPTPEFNQKINSINPEEIQNKYNLPEKYLFYPAQFWPHKNHIALILALENLSQLYEITLPVVFVGSDKGNKVFIEGKIDELKMNNQVYFLGFVPENDLISLYRNAFALIFLTFFGPDNLPPLEAFALGCPVIASNVAGASEQLGDAALLVNPTQPDKIALAIKSLVEDENLRQTLIQRGKIRASQWTTQNYIQGIFTLLDEFQTIRRCWNSKL